MFDFSIFATADAWMSLLMLTFMEVILGIDNIIFITIVANKLAKEDQRKARNIGLFLAMLMRIVLLFGIFWIVKMSEPLFEINFLGLHGAFTGQSLILIGGGLFLMYKSTTEIHHKLEGASPEAQKNSKKATLSQIVLQIVLLNIVFSFDSILTAVGLTPYLIIMILGVVISMIIMMLFAAPIGNFVNDRPTVQMLGLAFLILIGFMLIAEGAHQAHLIPGKEGEEVVPKGYIYFAIFFSLGVEMLNLRLRKKAAPVQLHGPVEEAKEEGLI